MFSNECITYGYITLLQMKVRDCLLFTEETEAMPHTASLFFKLKKLKKINMATINIFIL